MMPFYVGDEKIVEIMWIMFGGLFVISQLLVSRWFDRKSPETALIQRFVKRVAKPVIR